MRKTWVTWTWIFMLLVALFSEAAFGRRGGGRGGGSSKGRGSGTSSSSASRGGFHALPRKSTSSGQSQPGGSGSSSGRGAKMAGAAAVGAAVGYGLSSLGRPRYSRGGGYGSSSASKPVAQPGFQNPNWSDPMMESEVYSQASKEPCGVTLLTFSPVICGVTYLLAQG
ncbi:keratin, type I cytoskeletal 9-like [Sceloporus undulatus]|uniref:keratin, type I cytoskeletal 9-like n=1 Tax=Sceloporus undulatus TaxID=8520 RepID=UPI001C4BD935|nr:keratin, type I cytoskeletal 9-like [Sceloporus undulatus]